MGVERRAEGVEAPVINFGVKREGYRNVRALQLRQLPERRNAKVPVDPGNECVAGAE